MAPPSSWFARGLLFENCSCQTVCPGHMHYSQMCTYERCKGYWALRFDEGELDGVSLAGVKAVVVYDCPQNMIEGDWTEGILIDSQAGSEQHRVIERMIRGEAGGPWAVLSRFVGTWLETRSLPVEIVDEEDGKELRVGNLLDSRIEAIRGKDRSLPVTFENLFNQIHAPRQVVGRGDARFDDGTISFDQRQSHSLWSSFDWQVNTGTD